MFFTTVLVLAPAALPLPQTNYDFVQLTGAGGVGLAQVYDINDSGVVAGSAMTAAGERPALWSLSGGLQVLSGFNQASAATSVNDAGQVSGSLLVGNGNADRGFLLDAGVITIFEPVGTTEVTAGVDIAEDGSVLVASGFLGGTAADRNLISRALIGTSAGLGPVIAGAFPRSISAGGSIAGTGSVVINGQVFSLGEIMAGDSPRAAAVNDSGVTVGRIVRTGGGFSSSSTPVIWDTNQVPSVLPVPNASSGSVANDINNGGQIVGRADNQAYVMELGGAVLILSNVTSSTPAGVRLREANEINELGQILGTADNGSFLNEFRFLAVPQGQAGNSFCLPGLNSLQRTATLAAMGSTSVSDNALSLRATDARDGFGLFFSSPNQAAPSPLGDGFLCLGDPFQRIPPAIVIQDGVGSVDLNLTMLGIAAGDTVSFQFWYRDVTAGGAGFNLSQGLEVTFEQ